MIPNFIILIPYIYKQLIPFYLEYHHNPLHRTPLLYLISEPIFQFNNLLNLKSYLYVKYCLYYLKVVPLHLNWLHHYLYCHCLQLPHHILHHHLLRLRLHPHHRLPLPHHHRNDQLFNYLLHHQYSSLHQ